MKRTLPFVAFFLVACGSAPPPECEAQKSPVSLVKNGGFECGDASEWAPQFGDFAAVSSGARTGMRAGQLTAAATGSGQFAYSMPVVAKTSGKPYCVNAWVKGTATAVKMEVLANVSGMALGFSSPVEAGWLQMPPVSNLQIDVPKDDTLYLRFRLTNGAAGQTLLIDDVDFWESSSGACDERH